MALKRTTFTTIDILRYHPHCVQCSKPITEATPVISIRHNAYDGTPDQTDCHEDCFMKFANSSTRSPAVVEKDVPRVITHTEIHKSKEAIRELAGV